MIGPKYHFIEFIYTSVLHQIVVRDKSVANLALQDFENFS